jgi:hypothetical protein
MAGLAEAAQTQINLADIEYSLNTGSWSSIYATPYDVPEEPTFTGEAPTDPALTSVGTVTPFDKSEAPDVSFDMTGAPGDGPGTSLTALPELTALSLPTFSTTVPEIDVASLTSAYSYTEPTYTALVKSQTQAELTSVLGGSLIVPIAVWDALWDRAAADLAKVQVADTWAASNLAAGLSMSGMVSEALTSRLETAQQRTSDAAVKTKLEQSIQEATQRREDLWNAVTQAIAFEGLWLTHHEALAGRALAAAAKAHEALVAATNVNILRFNALLERVKIEIEADRLELEIALAPLQEIAAEIQLAALRVQQDDQQIKRWLGLWEGWKIDKTIRADVLRSKITAWGTEMQAESSRLNGDIDIQKLTLTENEQLLNEFTTKWNGLAIKSKAVNDLYGARIAASNLALEDKKTELGYSKMELEKSIEAAWREPQVAIEKAKLQIEQALGVLQRIAELQTGLAQAYLAGSDASLGASAASNYQGSCSGSIPEGEGCP